MEFTPLEIVLLVAFWMVMYALGRETAGKYAAIDSCNTLIKMIVSEKKGTGRIEVLSDTRIRYTPIK